MFGFEVQGGPKSLGARHRNKEASIINYHYSLIRDSYFSNTAPSLDSGSPCAALLEAVAQARPTLAYPRLQAIRLLRF